MTSLVDAPTRADTETNDTSPMQTDQPRLGTNEVDVLIIYEDEPLWLPSALSRLNTRGWHVQCLQASQSFSDICALTIVIIGATSVNPSLYNHGQICCVLPDLPNLPNLPDFMMSNTTTDHSYADPNSKGMLGVHQVVQTIEQLITTGYTLKGAKVDPRFKRTHQEIQESLKNIIRQTQVTDSEVCDNLEVWSYSVMNQISDVISSAVYADLAYGELNTEHVLLMYIDLHRELCKYITDLCTVGDIRSTLWHHTCLVLLTAPHEPYALDLAGPSNVNFGGVSEPHPLLMSKDEIIASQSLLETKLIDLHLMVTEHQYDRNEVQHLINAYRLRWEHVLVARHTAQSCCSLNLLIDTLSDDDLSAHDIIQIFISAARLVAPMTQSGHLRGALGVYTHAIERLYQQTNSIHDSHLAESITYLRSILLDQSTPTHSEVIDIFDEIKLNVEHLVKTYHGQDLEEIIHLSTSKIV